MTSDVPETTVTIIPTMRYDDAPRAIEWLSVAFGFEARFVVPGEGDTIAHAQLTFGNGMVMVGSARDDAYGQLVQPPEPGRPCTQSPYIVVTDVDDHCRRAREHGAEIVMEPVTEPHGRMYSCRDPQGQLWNFGDYDPWKPV